MTFYLIFGLIMKKTMKIAKAHKIGKNRKNYFDRPTSD